MLSINITKQLKRSQDKEIFIQQTVDNFVEGIITAIEYIRISSRKFLPNEQK